MIYLCGKSIPFLYKQKYNEWCDCYLNLVFFCCSSKSEDSEGGAIIYCERGKMFYIILKIALMLLSCGVKQNSLYFLCATAAIAVAHLSHRNSVCLSHRWISQKLYHWLPGRL